MPGVCNLGGKTLPVHIIALPSVLYTHIKPKEISFSPHD